MVPGSFWPKLVKSMCFKPNERHEQFRSSFFIGKSSGISPKALTKVRFVNNSFWETGHQIPVRLLLRVVNPPSRPAAVLLLGGVDLPDASPTYCWGGRPPSTPKHVLLRLWGGGVDL